MKLVIAEKPSVAQSLARVIGAAKRQDRDLINIYTLPEVWSEGFDQSEKV